MTCCLNLVAIMCKLTPSIINFIERVLKHLLNNDYDSLSKFSSVKINQTIKELYTNLLASCIGIFGYLVTIPLEDTLLSSRYFSRIFMDQIEKKHSNSHLCRIEHDMLIGLSVSDRWCLVTVLSEVLKESVYLDTSLNTSTRALKSICFMMSSAPIDLFNMLLAQQLPSVLCDCMSTNKRRSIVSSLTDVTTIFNAEVIHTISILLHSSNVTFEVNTPMPLELILEKSMSSANINFETLSSQVILRQRVARLITERLTEFAGQKLNIVLNLFLYTCESQFTSQLGENQNSTGSNDSIEQINSMRLDILIVLAHITTFSGRYLCTSIARYNNCSVLPAIFNYIQCNLKNISSRRRESSSEYVKSSSLIYQSKG